MLSFRDVAELLAVRCIVVTSEIVRQWRLDLASFPRHRRLTDGLRRALAGGPPLFRWACR